MFILLAAAVAVAPQLLRGNSCGHDFDLHLVSWFDCLNSWRHGTLYPHWAPSPNYGAGEPRFIFYPPLMWMLGAALGFVLPWTLVPVALTFLLLAGTGLAAWALAREALDEAPAALAGCAALFSGYALFTAYERSAFAELAGGLWIPLLLLFALRGGKIQAVPASSPAWGRALNGSAAVAVVVAGAWLSNPTVGVMACYLLAAVALTRALLAKSWVPVLRASVALALGMGLSGIYLLPVAAEQGWADLKQVTYDPGQTLENSWLFARHADPALSLHDQVLFQVSVIAVTMIAVALASLLVCWRRRRLPGPPQWWIPLALIPAAVLLLQLPVSHPVWNALPELRFLQFPWRWLLALEAPMGVFFAAAVWRGSRRRRIAVAAACAASFLGLTIFAAESFFQVCDDEDAVAPMLKTYHAGAGFIGLDEYEPKGADNSLLASGLPAACLVGDPAAVLGKSDPENPDSNPVWTPNQGSCLATFAAANGSQANPEHLQILASIAQPGYLVLRLRSYPAWRIRVNGRLATYLPKRDDGLIAVPVSQGPIDLNVDWITTPDVVAGCWLSAVSVFLLTALSFYEPRRTRARLT